MLLKGHEKVKKDGHIACDLRRFQPQGTPSLNKSQRKEACHGYHCDKVSLCPSSGILEILSQTSASVIRKPRNAVQTVSFPVSCVRAHSFHPPTHCHTWTWCVLLELSLGRTASPDIRFIQQQRHISTVNFHVLYLVVIFFFMVLGFYMCHEVFMLLN